MISVVRLWETIMQTAKQGTSGYQSDDEFNRDLSAVQTDLITLLAPNYALNTSIEELLSPFVARSPTPVSTTVAGVLTKPAGYMHLASASISGYPVTRVDVNERDMLRFVPSRRPSVADNRYVYFLSDGNVNILPAQVHSVDIIYIRHPDAASLALTPVSTGDEDYEVPTAVDDLEWPEQAFNLIYYMMLSRLGIEAKESLLAEFSNIGLRNEAAKLV